MSAWLSPEPANWREAAISALAEDIGPGDVTSACLPEDLRFDWFLEAQAEGIACGIGIAEFVLGPPEGSAQDLFVRVCAPDGQRVQSGTRILEGRGLARDVLSHERVALNFLMLLSGVASLTARFVEETEGTSARIVDTRKTIPGLRSLQKYAVRCGGGANHRMGLYDAAMLKDNHVAVLGGVSQALKQMRVTASHMTKIEVEVATLAQLHEALDANADVILLDNMSTETMREAVAITQGRALLEASGGIQLSRIAEIAATGVDLISVGALTHSAPSLPFHLEANPV